MSNDTLWEKLAVQEDQIADLMAENAAQAQRVAELEAHMQRNDPVMFRAMQEDNEEIERLRAELTDSDNERLEQARLLETQDKRIAELEAALNAIGQRIAGPTWAMGRDVRNLVQAALRREG